MILYKYATLQFALTPIPQDKRRENVVKASFIITAYHHYVPSTFGQGQPNVCPFCHRTVEHTIALTVTMGNEKREREAHADCVTQN
jgi:hypothetical protein